MDPLAIELSGVTKDYASGQRGFRLRALDDVTLQIPRGQIYGLLGPNGSGKSTAIKLTLGLLTPTVGLIRVMGLPAGSMDARRVMGYLPEAPYFYRRLTGRELLGFHGELCGLRGRPLASRIDEVLALVAMDFAASRRLEAYSKGMLQRIGLAQALIHDPQLLILDEPTAGVDPEGTDAMGELILKLKAMGKTVLITSHLLDQIEVVCDRIAILDRGQLLSEGAVADLVNIPSNEPDAYHERSPANRWSSLGRLDRFFLSTIRAHRERERAEVETSVG